MEGMQNYIDTQKTILGKMQKSIETGRKILDNIKLTNSYTDNFLKVYNANERSTAITHYTEGTESSDEVYKKLSEVGEYAYDP